VGTLVLASPLVAEEICWQEDGMTMDAGPRPGLTTTKAPFIEAMRCDGRMYIDQPYDQYSDENHDVFRRLYQRMVPRWQKYAPETFLEGLDILQFDASRVPRLEDANRFLHAKTGFRAKAVSGYIPAFHFFDCLRHREFPTTITVRDKSAIDYLPEPDIFHDICGHVPLHTNKAFADALVAFGQCAHTAARIVANITDEKERTRRLVSIFKGLARFFWFTVEFGLMRSPGGGLKAYGAGLLSSYGELAYSIDSKEAQRYPIELPWVINQYFEIDHYQPLLFIIDSFEHLYALAAELEKWMLDGRLDNVAPGEPHMNDEDVKSFLEAAVRVAN
jgi:phenylalanine-4-hydroxylase